MGRFSDAAKQAAALTDQQLASEITANGSFNRHEVQRLFPEKRDKEAFVRLMDEVESERSEDEKLAFLRDNIQTAGKVVLKILGTLV